MALQVFWQHFFNKDKTQNILNKEKDGQSKGKGVNFLSPHNKQRSSHLLQQMRSECHNWIWESKIPDSLFVCVNNFVQNILVKLVSMAGTGFFYTTTKNPQATRKLFLRKYDPHLGTHTLFRVWIVDPNSNFTPPPFSQSMGCFFCVCVWGGNGHVQGLIRWAIYNRKKELAEAKGSNWDWN